MKKTTRVNHPPAVELPPGNRPLVGPIYQTVKFEFDSVEETEAYLRGERAGFYYSRTSNPTTRQLELLLAELGLVLRQLRLGGDDRALRRGLGEGAGL